jgi:uncharacterized protein YbjT (DUF2867 family)
MPPFGILPETGDIGDTGFEASMTDSNARDSAPGITLVFGASGYIGRHLVPRLAARGHRVRAAARKRAGLEAEGWNGVELVSADALDPDSLPAALAGVRVAYYLVHSMAAGADFPERDRQAARNFTAAAAEAGVERIVYLGGLTPERPESAHLASRQETGEILRDGTIPVTELRAAIVIGPGSVAFEAMRDLAAHLPIMITPRWVRTKSPPVALDDLLDDLVEIPAVSEAAGHVFDVGGPELLSYEDMLRQIADALGRRQPLILPVPVLSPELSSYWLELVTSTPANVARALIGGLKHDLHADDAELRRLLPRDLMSFRAAVERSFETEQTIEAGDRWREGAFELRGRRHDVSFYGKRLTRSADARRAAPEAVWEELAKIGTPEAGYFFLNPFWRLRRELDAVLGGRPAGPRRHAGAPVPGERFDFWRVLASKPGERLTLVSTLQAPGTGGLEFELIPRPDGGTRLSATIHWHPRGPAGLLYWYKLGPAHAAMLRGMVESVCRRAEAAERAPDGATRPHPA